MEPAIKTSFIPQDATAPASRHRRTGAPDLLLVLGIIAFAGSAALAVAVFLYSQYLNAEVASDANSLKKTEAEYQPALVNELTRLNDRMQVASQILDAHIAPTAFFAALDQSTAQTIAFDSLSFDDSDPSNVKIQLAGIAASVNAIAFEGDLISKSTVLKNPIFSNLARQPDGVHFSLSLSADPSALSYVQATGGQQAAVPQAASPTPASSTPSTSPFGQ